MLYEIKNIRQYPDEPIRRWFYDHSLDLTVWFDAHDDIIAFQLCYNKTETPCALTWNRDSGYRHNRIDDGERNRAGKMKGIPILVQNGVFPHHEVAETFNSLSGGIEPAIAKFVYRKLKSYRST